MDNIVFEKIWQDGEFIELRISSDSEFLSIYQRCYVQDEQLLRMSNEILAYINNYNEPCYLQLGEKEGNYPPAFSMNILPIDNCGHMKIEMDFEIEDNDMRAHRCCFYINSELGLIERLGGELKQLVTSKMGTKVSLI